MLLYCCCFLLALLIQPISAAESQPQPLKPDFKLEDIQSFKKEISSLKTWLLQIDQTEQVIQSVKSIDRTVSLVESFWSYDFFFRLYQEEYINSEKKLVEHQKLVENAYAKQSEEHITKTITLEIQNSQLQNQVRSLDSELQKQKKENGTLLARIAAQTEMLNTKINEVKKLQMNIASHNTEYEHLISKLQGSFDKTTANQPARVVLEMTVDKTMSRLQSCIELKEQLAKENQALSQQINEFKKIGAITALPQPTVESQKSLDELQSQNQLLAEHTDKLNITVKELQNQIDDKNTQIQTLQQQISMNKIQEASGDGTLSVLTPKDPRESEALGTQNEELLRETSSKSSKIAQLQMQLENSLKKVASLKDTVVQLNEQVSYFKEQNSKLLIEIAHRDAGIDTATTDTFNLRQFDAPESANDSLSAGNAVLRQQVKELSQSKPTPKPPSPLTAERIGLGVCVVLLVTVCLMAYGRERTRPRCGAEAASAEEGRAPEQERESEDADEPQKALEPETPASG